MAKNMVMTRSAQICIAAAVATGTVSGQVVLIGTDGLVAHALTDRATTATINSGAAAPGLIDGQASVVLVGVHLAVRLTLLDAVALGAKVYVKTDGTYSGIATSAVLIGHALEAIGVGASGVVGLK